MASASASASASAPATAAAAADTAKALQLPASIDPPGPDNPPKQAVWIIFGATGHIGRSLTRTALRHGDKVTAVGRVSESSLEQMRGWHADCHGTLCDVRVRESVEAVVREAVARFGRVDVIANCTGYGVVAAAEDQSQHDLENQFSTNFMGTLHILQSSLAYFRTSAIAGRYLIFSSTAGALGIPGMAPYCATKYAVEGLVESMLYEVDTYGIKATLVEPGYLRDDDVAFDSASKAILTDDAAAPVPTADSVPAPTSTRKTTDATPGRIKHYGHFFVKPNPSPPYNNPNSPSGHARRTFQWIDANQPTSAVRSAELVWQLAHSSYPPLRLLLGTYAVESIRDRLRSVTEEIEDWKHLNFPAAESVAGSSKNGDHQHAQGQNISDDEHDSAGDS